MFYQKPSIFSREGLNSKARLEKMGFRVQGLSLAPVLTSLHSYMQHALLCCRPLGFGVQDLGFTCQPEDFRAPESPRLRRHIVSYLISYHGYNPFVHIFFWITRGGNPQAPSLKNLEPQKKLKTETPKAFIKPKNPAVRTPCRNPKAGKT